MFPFAVRGDAILDDTDRTCDISCVINFYGRIHLLEGILYSLSSQDIDRDRFEVILVEDRGGTEQGRDVVRRHGHALNIKYVPLAYHYGIMGHSRNVGLAITKGRYILFLDDDTIILQRTFLSVLLEEFARPGADAIVPHGSASYCRVRGKYSYHDPYYPTNRCVAYSATALKELGGFVSQIVGQEDVEFVIRYIASGRKFRYSDKLAYLHPPLIVGNLSKPAAVGSSFARLRKRYPLLVWFLLLLNGSRYLPLCLLPLTPKWRMQGKFSLGFVLGIAYALVGRRTGYE